MSRHGVKLTAPGHEVKVPGVRSEAAIEELKTSFAKLWSEEVDAIFYDVRTITCPSCESEISYNHAESYPKGCKVCMTRFVNPDMVNALEGSKNRGEVVSDG